jgi:hypothetical protein
MVVTAPLSGATLSEPPLRRVDGLGHEQWIRLVNLLANSIFLGRKRPRRDGMFVI